MYVRNYPKISKEAVFVISLESLSSGSWGLFELREINKMLSILSQKFL